MTIFYSAATGGLYLSGVHQLIPDDSIEISDEEYEFLQSNGFANVVTGRDGRPTIGVQERSSDELALLARRQRDRLLRETDGYMQPDTPMTKAQRVKWAAYRDALRNVPDQAGFPTVIDWPVRPDVVVGSA